MGILFAILIGGGIIFAEIYFMIIRPKKIEKEAKERVANMSKEEKQALLWKSSWEGSYGSLPKNCPKCGAVNYEKTEIGYPLSKWELISTKTVDSETFDKAYTLGGATTLFTKKQTKQVKTYKCPKCGYIHTVG